MTLTSPFPACEHDYMRDGEVVIRPVATYTETWAKYVCRHCLNPRYALIKTYSESGEGTRLRDGSNIVDRPQGLRR